MGLGYGTMVALPDGRHAAIEDIAMGDQVLVGSRDGEALSWSIAAATFSHGARGHQPAIYYLRFDNDSELVCTLDQPLLRADKRMVRARDLVPADRLLAPDGTTFGLSFHSVGSWDRGVHAIALPGGWDGRPDGHLINAAGVVAGDWLVEMHLG